MEKKWALPSRLRGEAGWASPHDPSGLACSKDTAVGDPPRLPPKGLSMGDLPPASLTMPTPHTPPTQDGFKFPPPLRRVLLFLPQK